MASAWAQRQEALLRDCIVSPDVFNHMVERLRDFAVPYQHALETEAGQRNVYLYLQGLLSHLPRKNAEAIATLVDVERLVMQDFLGTAPWDHRPLVQVLVGQVVERLGEPDGIIAFDPSSFPKRGTHSVGVKRQWCSHRGKVDNCQVGGYMGYVSRHDHALLDFRLSLPQEWAGDAQRRQECHVPEEEQYHTRQEQCLEMLDLRGEQVPHGWGMGPEEWLVVTRRPLTDDRALEVRASRDATDQDAQHRYQYYLAPRDGSKVALKEPSLSELARVIKAGACIEASFQRGKGEVGMDEYQVRTWEGWHHHMALTLIAVWFLIGETHRGQQVTPALTLPQVRYGLSVLLLEVCCTPGIDSLCRQVQRQLLRNESARFYHHRARKRIPSRKLRREIQ